MLNACVRLRAAPRTTSSTFWESQAGGTFTIARDTAGPPLGRGTKARKNTACPSGPIVKRETPLSWRIRK